MQKELENKLRNLRIDLLNYLNVIATTDSVAMDLHEISQSTNTSEVDLKGIITTLRRIKVEDESIIQPAGRDHKGRLRWKINESVVEKNTLAKFLEKEILGKT